MMPVTFRMRFLLLNPNSTFVEVPLSGGAVTILPKSKAGPFSEKQITPELKLMISRRVLVAEKAPPSATPRKHRTKSSRNKGDNE